MLFLVLLMSILNCMMLKFLTLFLLYHLYLTATMMIVSLYRRLRFSVGFILLLFGCWFVLARMGNPNNSIGGFSVFFFRNFPLIYCPACSCIWEALQNYKRIRIKNTNHNEERRSGAGATMIAVINQ